MTVRCVQCGELALADDARYCVGCGAALPEPLAVPDDLVIRPERRRRDRLPVVSEQAMVIGVVVAIFVILVLIVVLTW